MQDEDDTTRFWFVERWQSREAEREYVASSMSTPDSDVLLEMLVAPPQTIYCRTIWAPPARSSSNGQQERAEVAKPRPLL